jgi:hypothetical protein
MITIEGLTEQQRRLADIAWAIDTEQQLAEFCASLRGQQQRDMRTVIELIVAAELDHCVEAESDCDLANEVLDGVR